jgi:hypothetical protein
LYLPALLDASLGGAAVIERALEDPGRLGRPDEWYVRAMPHVEAGLARQACQTSGPG